jgi:hypothetical protein
MYVQLKNWYNQAKYNRWPFVGVLPSTKMHF